MSNLFIGFIFTLLNFTINIGPITIGLIPDFVGYVFIVNGLNDLNHESGCFSKAKPWAIVMAIYSAIQYVMDIFGISSYLEMLGMFTGIACVAIDIYIVLQIINGIKEMEANDCADYEIDRVKSVWVVMIVINVIVATLSGMTVLSVYVGLFSGIAALYLALAIPIIIAVFAVNILFLVRFNRTKKLVEFAKPILEAKKRHEGQMNQ